MIPKEVFGNIDLFIITGARDERDKKHLGLSLGMDFPQQDHMSRLGEREAICCLIHSPFKHPFVIEIPFVESDATTHVEKATFVKNLSWTPLPEGKDIDSEFSDDEKRFLRGVLQQANQALNFSQRFGLARIRSIEVKQRLRERLEIDGWISVKALSQPKGPPHKLCEPTNKLFDRFNVTWTKLSRGHVATRVATLNVYNKLQERGGTNKKEGRVNGKQVDILRRNDSNELSTIEIAGSVAEVANVLHCLDCEEVKRHVVITTTSKILKGVKEQFQKFPEIVQAMKAKRVLAIGHSTAMARDDWIL